MQKQMSEKEKIKKADFIIENNSDLETLKSFTKQTINELEKMDL
jgi:dephospho-CoA kinase